MGTGGGADRGSAARRTLAPCGRAGMVLPSPAARCPSHCRVDLKRQPTRVCCLLPTDSDNSH